MDVLHYEDKSKQKSQISQGKQGKMFRLVRISMTSFLHRKSEQRLNERITDASPKEILQIAMWRLQFCFQKKSFEKTRHSSPVAL